MTKEEIKDLRAALGLTQEEFAHQAGVSTSIVSKWETGQRSPGRMALRLLATMQRRRERLEKQAGKSKAA